jgi:hypothetical protein
MSVVEDADKAPNGADLVEGPKPAELVISAELALAYDQHTGRLYRLDGAGRIRHELALWRHRKDRAGEITINTMLIGGCYKVLTHVIFRVMMQRWPRPGHVIDHRDRDRTNNAFDNLREATHAENSRNGDRGAKRRWGLGETLEQGTRKLPNGRYVVVVRGVYIGTFEGRNAANQACREHRRAWPDPFDVPFVSWRRIIRGR